MQVKKKLFPYPIINHNSSMSNYGNKIFDFIFEQEQDDNSFILKNARFQTDSEIINYLYDKGDILVYCVIECSDTVYRRKTTLTREGQDIILPKVDFSERVDVSMFAVAAKDFRYQSDEYDDDYKGFDIVIEKNDIIGANDGFRLVFDHAEEEDSFAHSIFSVIPSQDLDAGAYTVECSTGRKIVITMSECDYQNYKTIYTLPLYMEVFFNMILIPALIEGLSLCQIYLKEHDGQDLDEVGNYYIWFRSVLSAYKKLTGNELNIEDFKKESVSYFAQKIMGKPLGGALDKMVKEMNKPKKIGGEENE